MARSAGPHVRTPMSRVRPREALPVGREQVRYLVTRRGAIAVRELAGEHGGPQLALDLGVRDPREDVAADSTTARRPGVVVGESEGRTLIAVEVDEPPRTGLGAGPLVRLEDLRRAAPLLSADQLGIALAAVALGSWHRDTVFCSSCGGRLRSREDGWALHCEQEGLDRFPRTDPVVIMALRDEEDRLLLAESVRVNGAFASVLAGFVEAGETAEAAVRREVREEVGLEVIATEYTGSQPWPFPRSLMLGFRAAVAAPDPVAVQVSELRWARWFTREQLREELGSERLSLPGLSSLGRALIEDWYGEPLPA